MPAETVLLIVIAVCCVLITLVMVVAAIVLARAAAGLGQTKARVDKIIGDVDRETNATFEQLRSTTKGIGDLSWVLKRLGEEAVVGMVGRSLRRTPRAANPPPAEPSANLSAVYVGIDTAFRVAEFLRSIRAKREARTSSTAEDE